MKKVVLAIACVWGTCLPAVAADDAASAPVKPEERMDRAKRDASNPLRMIIQASQVKTRSRTADLPDPASTSSVVPVAAQATTARPAPAVARPATAAAPQPAPGVATEVTRSLVGSANRPARAAANSGAAERVEPQSAPAPEATVTTAATPPSTETIAAPITTPAPSTALALSNPAANTAASPTGSVSPAQAAKAAEPAPVTTIEVPLKLVQYIEPEIPQRLRARLRNNNEVTVGFTVNRDGSLSDVGIRASTNRALDDAVLDAVRQWRYGPLPEPREGTVQLVFNLGE